VKVFLLDMVAQNKYTADIFTQYITMSGLKPLIEHHVPENPVVQEKKITHAQQMILLQVYLADVLLF